MQRRRGPAAALVALEWIGCRGGAGRWRRSSPSSGCGGGASPRRCSSPPSGRHGGARGGDGCVSHRGGAGRAGPPRLSRVKPSSRGRRAERPFPCFLDDELARIEDKSATNRRESTTGSGDQGWRGGGLPLQASVAVDSLAEVSDQAQGGGPGCRRPCSPRRRASPVWSSARLCRGGGYSVLALRGEVAAGTRAQLEAEDTRGGAVTCSNSAGRPRPPVPLLAVAGTNRRGNARGDAGSCWNRRFVWDKFASLSFLQKASFAYEDWQTAGVGLTCAHPHLSVNSASDVQPPALAHAWRSIGSLLSRASHRLSRTLIGSLRPHATPLLGSMGRTEDFVSFVGDDVPTLILD
jgi:hypothetical protein